MFDSKKLLIDSLPNIVGTVIGAGILALIGLVSSLIDFNWFSLWSNLIGLGFSLLIVFEVIVISKKLLSKQESVKIYTRICQIKRGNTFLLLLGLSGTSYFWSINNPTRGFRIFSCVSVFILFLILVYSIALFLKLKSNEQARIKIAIFVTSIIGFIFLFVFIFWNPAREICCINMQTPTITGTTPTPTITVTPPIPTVTDITPTPTETEPPPTPTITETTLTPTIDHCIFDAGCLEFNSWKIYPNNSYRADENGCSPFLQEWGLHISCNEINILLENSQTQKDGNAFYLILDGNYEISFDLTIDKLRGTDDWAYLAFSVLSINPEKPLHDETVEGLFFVRESNPEALGYIYYKTNRVYVRNFFGNYIKDDYGEVVYFEEGATINLTFEIANDELNILESNKLLAGPINIEQEDRGFWIGYYFSTTGELNASITNFSISPIK